jgi:succinyl-diaminopimelate desuccinylase
MSMINKDFLVEITQEMIRIPTVNPPGQEYHKFVDYVAQILRRIGLQVEIINYESKYPILYAHINKGHHPEIHFNGHYDVVPVQGTWTMPPFGGDIDHNKIFGRGAADMKGGIGSFLCAIAAIINLKNKISGCISLSLVPDEETGGALGSKTFVEVTNILPDIVIIPEPSFPRVLLGHKGVVQLYVEAVGKTAHAAMPNLGKNAFEQITKLSNLIIEKWAIKEGIINSDIRNKYPQKEDPLLLPTMTMGGISSSGNAVNSVPDIARFSIDRRFLPIETAENVFAEIENFVLNQGNNYRVIEVLMANSSITPRRIALPLLHHLQTAIQKACGTLAPETISSGYDDTRYFRSQGPIPCFTYGPGYSGTAHIQDEYVDIQRLVEVSNVFFYLIAKVLEIEL